jgi:hypothetical protein
MKFLGSMERGQVSVFDLLASTFLFIIIFTAMRGIWLGNIDTAMNEMAFNEMQVKAQQVLDSLIKTEGYPSNWNSENVQLIGLADKPNIIGREKLSAFKTMDYNVASSRLSLGSYDFNFELTQNGAVVKSVGIPVDTNKTVISLERIVIYGGSEAHVTFRVFQK